MKRFFLFLSLIAGLLVGCDKETPVTPSIHLAQGNIDSWFEAADYSVAVDATCAWSATSDSEWVVIKTENGTKGRSELQFSLLENKTDAVRTAKIIVANEEHNLAEELLISQEIFRNEYLEISYTSIDGKAVEPYDAAAFGAEIESNTYENGIGKIRFKSAVSKVGESAFSENETLKTLTLPNSVQAIGSWALFGCVYLENIILGNRVVTIGEAAFSACSRLKEITLPESLETVGASAFFGCSSMTAFYGKFASEDNRCLVIDNILVKFAPKGIKIYEIAEGITAIAADAFYESRLTDVTIPQSTSSIGDYAFYYSESLKNVYCKAATPPTLGESVFDNFENGLDKPIGCKIHVPAASVEAYKTATNWERYAKYITGYDF